MEYIPIQVCQAIREFLLPPPPLKPCPFILSPKGGSKLERARDLFEQAHEKCPPKSCKPLFLMYAQLEEEHGLAKRAMSIFDRATQVVADEDKFEVKYFICSTQINQLMIRTFRCLLSISPKRQLTMAFPPLAPSTSEHSRSSQTGKQPRCVSDSPLSNANSAKSIERGVSTRTRPNSATRE